MIVGSLGIEKVEKEEKLKMVITGNVQPMVTSPSISNLFEISVP